MAKETKETAAAETTPAAAAVKMPVIPLVLAIVVAAVVAVGGAGGAMFWLVRSGRVPLGGGPQKVEAATIAAPRTHMAALDPLLVNLADEGGRCYLRVTLTLSVEDKPLPKGEKAAEEKAPKGGKAPVEHEAEIRDAAFSVMGNETTTSLLAPDGKESLKSKLQAAFAKKVPDMKIDEIYLTEFLVQR